MTHRKRLHQIIDTLPAWEVDALLSLLEQQPDASPPPPAGQPEYDPACDELLPHLGL
jgi:hypothetical protein